jgi:hypothetical protein
MMIFAMLNCYVACQYAECHYSECCGAAGLAAGHVVPVGQHAALVSHTQYILGPLTYLKLIRVFCSKNI